MSEQYRPRLSKEEYEVVLAMRSGWTPDLSEAPDVSVHKTPAKVLVFDIETAPLRSYTWGVWKQNIANSQIISEWFMLSWAAKWLFEDDVFSDVLTPKEALEEDDKRICETLWYYINEADIIIAHNANNFDIKKINTRFILNDLQPPMPYQVIDTLEHLRKRFSMTSNRLDYVNKLLGIGRKIKTDFELWSDSMIGDKSALDKMRVYNEEDVRILEETYLKIRAWIKPHPNLGLFIEDSVSVCPSCGVDDLTFHDKPYATVANLYRMFRCNNCGSVGREKKAIKNELQTRPVPK